MSLLVAQIRGRHIGDVIEAASHNVLLKSITMSFVRQAALQLEDPVQKDMLLCTSIPSYGTVST